MRDEGVLLYRTTTITSCITDASANKQHAAAAAVRESAHKFLLLTITTTSNDIHIYGRKSYKSSFLYSLDAFG